MNAIRKSAAAVGAAILGLTIAACSHAPSSPVLSPACKHMVAEQRAYVQNAIDQGYPNIDVSTGMSILMGDAAILHRAAKVCPPTTKIAVLPS